MAGMRQELPMNRLSLCALALLTALLGAAWLACAAPPEKKPADADRPPDGWTTAAPRDEICPAFAYDPAGGPDRKGAFVIKADRREGLDGCWTRTFPVAGGKHYRFRALFQAKGVAVPRRSVLARIEWQDDRGKKVPLDEPAITGYLRGATPMAEPEFPTTRGTDAAGWAEVSDTYRAPSKATRAVVELHLRWAANAEVRWANVALTEAEPPAPRKVRLAAAHFRPQ